MKKNSFTFKLSESQQKALLNLLRESLGSLPVALPDVKRAPSDVMTRWLSERKATDKFLIEHDCELYNPLDGSNIIRCKSQDLVTDELKALLAAGKRVKTLVVTWNNMLNCIICDDLTVKRLRFEGMKEETANEEVESAAQKFDQEFALMTMELSELFKDMFKAFSGLVKKE